MARTALPRALCCAPRLCAKPWAAARWCVELCAAFEIGSTNTKDCAPIYSRLTTEEACKSLADIAGASLAIVSTDMYDGSAEYSYYPAGCFRHTVSGKFYWNTHGSGASNLFVQPLCAGAPNTRTAAMRARRNA